MGCASNTVSLAVEAASPSVGVEAAGCDVVLHCNGALSEMRAVASQTPQLSGVALQRANAALGQLRAPDALDEAAARAEFSQLMAEANWPPIEALQS